MEYDFSEKPSQLHMLGVARNGLSAVGTGVVTRRGLAMLLPQAVSACAAAASSQRPLSTVVWLGLDQIDSWNLAWMPMGTPLPYVPTGLVYPYLSLEPQSYTGTIHSM